MGKCSTKGYDWGVIQKYYSEGHTYRETSKKFNVNMAVISTARKEGLIKTRNPSEARKLSHSIKGSTKHKQETKDRISKSRKKYLQENPDKAPYLLNHYSKGRSYPEEYFYKWLVKERVDFQEKFRVDTYELDFLVNGCINLEIDGEQHYLDKRIVESDKRRNRYIEGLGFKVIRIKWSSYQKQSQEYKKRFLNDLLLKFDDIDDIQLKYMYKAKEKINCKFCNKETHNKKFCSNSCKMIHTNKNKRISRKTKIDWPPPEDVLNMVRATNFIQTGKTLGVSDNAIRKYLRKHGIIEFK